jgi:UDP-glucose 4-epimerase
MKILVTGGAGYIGSHAVRCLLLDGHEVTVLDNLSHGHREAIQSVQGKSALLIEGSTGDGPAVTKLLKSRQIEAVLHFAADIEVGESVIDPGKYYLNNFSNSVQLLTAMTEAGVKKIVFSSTAAVYGNSEKNPVEESQTLAPINPYGRSKLMTEMAIVHKSFKDPHKIPSPLLMSQNRKNRKLLMGLERGNTSNRVIYRE